MKIKKRGFFWFSVDKSTSPIPGLLTINKKGLIKLKLQKTRSTSPQDNSFKSIKTPHCETIQGQLSLCGRYVQLRGAKKVINNQVSAKECLISHKEIKENLFEQIDISLDGLQDWLKPSSINNNFSAYDGWSFTFTPSNSQEWKVSSGSISLKHSFTEDSVASDHYLKMRMASKVSHTPNTAKSSLEMQDWAHGLQDFILILTNQEFALKWPKLYWTEDNKQHFADYYFDRRGLSKSKLSWPTHLVLFDNIKNEFGFLLDNYMQDREFLGPGMHLYLADLRGKPLYLEHRFANLVWGLETISRRIEEPICDKKHKERVQKIETTIKNAKILNHKDRDLIKQRLERPNELTLSNRLLKLFRALKLNLTDESLTTFCQEIASLRNNLSHCGGEREPGEFDSFANKILKKIEALSVLYLLVLLQRIHLNDENLKLVFEGWPFQLGFILKQAGLTKSPN